MLCILSSVEFLNTQMWNLSSCFIKMAEHVHIGVKMWNDWGEQTKHLKNKVTKHANANILFWLVDLPLITICPAAGDIHHKLKLTSYLTIICGKERTNMAFSPSKQPFSKTASSLKMPTCLFVYGLVFPVQWLKSSWGGCLWHQSKPLVVVHKILTISKMVSISYPFSRLTTETGKKNIYWT